MIPLRSLLNGSLVLLASARQAVAASCWKDYTCSANTEPAFPGPWEQYMFAPSSRIVQPERFFPITNLNDVRQWVGQADLPHNGSLYVFDFGKEVGGIVSLKYSVSAAASHGDGRRPSSPQRGHYRPDAGHGAVGLAFTEAKNWIGEWSDSSNGDMTGPDGAIYSNFTGAGDVVYTMPDHKLRGGFRFLTLFLIADNASVDITDIELEIGFMPTWSNLQAYQGYFSCDDDLLNRIWYGGAYTLQTNTVPNTYGRWFPFLETGWENNGTLGNGSTILVDGAKRDREIWPGDMGVAVPSTFVSLGELEQAKNSLQSMYDYQNADGEFPQAGPPLLQQGSTTYHMWTMIGTYNYIFYTNDTAWGQSNWDGYKRAMDWVTSYQTYPGGLLDVTGTKGWGQLVTGYNETIAQMILYQTLITGAELARWVGDDPDLAATWTADAAKLQAATLKYCYDFSFGAFRSNATDTKLHDQGSNSMAVAFGVVGPDSAEAQSISQWLTTNWTPIGANCPELPGEVSPYISSFELQAHLLAGHPQRALDLMRLSWGWYINNPNGSESTTIEGYLVNGTFGYRWNDGYDNDFSYVSHSHGWSSGPTSALTTYIVGLSITSPAGATWMFAPQFGDLKTAEGGLTTSLGKYQAKWVNSGKGYSATIETPDGTEGVLVLPVVQQGRIPSVTVDGKKTAAEWFRRVEGVADLVEVKGVKGRSHTIEVR